jgi:hypothetical protein
MDTTQRAESVASLRHQRDLLGDALGRLLVKLGAASDVSMTGPELLLLAEDAIAHIDGAGAASGAT